MGKGIKRKNLSFEKQDSKQNSNGIMEKLNTAKLRDRLQKKVPVKVNSKTIVLIAPEKNNRDYIRKLTERFKSVLYER